MSTVPVERPRAASSPATGVGRSGGSPALTIVVPTYNERDNIGPLFAALAGALADIPFEVIFVDDNSPDETPHEVRALARVDRRCRLINRSERRGLSAAALEGMLSALSPVVAVIDGDLQHDETALPAMKAKIDAGAADIVVATRYASGRTGNALAGGRRMLSVLGGHLVRRLLKVDCSDPLSGFFMVRRSLVEAVARHVNLDGFKILVDILAAAPAATKVVEIRRGFWPRAHGRSKLDAKVALEFLALVISSLSRNFLPVRFILFGFVGAAGILVHMSTAWAALALGRDFFVAHLVATVAAMSSNFFLNNEITYRDRKLTGVDWISGLLLFYVICSVGAVGNVGVASLLFHEQPRWWLASFAGALIGTVWNYAISSTLVWRQR